MVLPDCWSCEDGGYTTKYSVLTTHQISSEILARSPPSTIPTRYSMFLTQNHDGHPDSFRLLQRRHHS